MTGEYTKNGRKPTKTEETLYKWGRKNQAKVPSTVIAENKREEADSSFMSFWTTLIGFGFFFGAIAYWWIVGG